MKTYRSINYKSPSKTVCALGCFDGVHVGHASIIKEAHKIAARNTALCAVWSFSEPPKNFFLAENEKISVLTTEEEKRREMRRLGVDIFVSVTFDQRTASLSAEDFFHSVLIGSMNAMHVVCGFNYRFGKGGEGNCDLLARLCEENGIGLSIIPPVKANGITVSSTEIRNSLNSGNITASNIYLGRPYSLSARVINGQHLGRTLGFPTVNQSFPPEKLVPKNGVYVSRITFDRKTRYGITNIGVRPTVDGSTLCAETNVFDFEGDLYGKSVTVEFLEFLRPEKKFESIEHLTNQVYEDISKAKEIIKKRQRI